MKAREHTDFRPVVAKALETIASQVLWDVDGGDPTGRRYYLTRRDVELFMKEDSEMDDPDDQYLTPDERHAVVTSLRNTETSIILF